MPRHDCPKCLSSSVDDSRQRFFELPLSLLCLMPYRCATCNHRFWRVSDRQRRKLLPSSLYALGFIFFLVLIWAIISSFWKSP
jgi:hypothetical protein